MTRRSASAPALLVAGLLLAALAGCAPIGAVLGTRPSGSSSATATSSPSPHPSDSSPAGPSGTPVSPAHPTAGGAGCTLNTPGQYQVGDCALLLVQGDGITVTAGTAGSLHVMGNHDQVLVDTAPGVRIEGQDNAVVAGGDIGGIAIQGDRNAVTTQGRIGSGSVTGNDNIVSGAAGVGAVTDDGARNSIG